MQNDKITINLNKKNEQNWFVCKQFLLQQIVLNWYILTINLKNPLHKYNYLKSKETF